MNTGRLFSINCSEESARRILKTINKYIKDENFEIGYYKPKEIKEKINKSLLKNGFVPKLMVFENSNKYIHLKKNDIGVQVQMGHYGQAYVDILKLSLAYAKGKISFGVLLVLGDENAKQSNNASFDGVVKDLKEFDAFLNCPIIVIEIK